MGKNGGRNSRKVVDKTGERLNVVYLPISELKPDPNNPVDHRPRQIRQIADSVGEFGFITPVVIGGNRDVIAGHGRILAASLLGWTKVPTISVDHLKRGA